MQYPGNDILQIKPHKNHMQQSEVLFWFIVENIVVTNAVTLLYLLFI